MSETICAADFGLGILAQCALHAKLSEVYQDLLSYSADSNELYIVGSDQIPPDLVGMTFDQCTNILSQRRDSNNPVVLLGFKRGEQIHLNPKDSRQNAAMRLEKDDAIVVMAYRPPNLMKREVPTPARSTEADAVTIQAARDAVDP